MTIENLKPFPPGVSGNPAGRPKSKPFKDALKKAIAMAGNDSLLNVATALVARASDGEIQAIKELADRLDGKVPQALVGDTEHAPIAISEVRRIIVRHDQPKS